MKQLNFHLAFDMATLRGHYLSSSETAALPPAPFSFPVMV